MLLVLVSVVLYTSLLVCPTKHSLDMEGLRDIGGQPSWSTQLVSNSHKCMEVNWQAAAYSLYFFTATHVRTHIKYCELHIERAIKSKVCTVLNETVHIAVLYMRY